MNTSHSITRPNVLWICTDQQRWDTLSYFGHAGAKTPNLDQLASSGVAFSRAYCQSPICTPSRASFLTGMYPIAHQIHRNGNDHFPDHLPLLPRILKKANYTTGLVGKLHLSRSHGQAEAIPTDTFEEIYWSHHPDPDWDTGHDYQDWLAEKGIDPEALFANQIGAIRPGLPAEYHQTTWAGERAQNFITKHKDNPWFLAINLFDPHPPFDPPREYMDRFDPDEMPKPMFDQRDIAQHAKFAGYVDQQAQSLIDPGIPAESLNQNSDTNHSKPPAHVDALQLRAAYHAMIAQVDDMVGKLVNLLEQTEQRRNTLVIFMSDHGEMLCDHGLLYKGCRFYEGLVHVPLIISHPETIPKGRVTDGLAELVDLPQTILDFADIPADPAMQGMSYRPFLVGDSKEFGKEYVVSEYFDAIHFPGSVGSRGSMFYNGRYKHCIYHDAHIGELFDHQTDPSEFIDLWDNPDYKNLQNKLTEKHLNAMMLRSGTGPQRVADY